PGRVVDHPSILEGSIEEISQSAHDLTARPGVDGLDLLAHRWQGDVPQLVRSVVDSATGPVIGGAIFDSRLPAGHTVREQVECALAMAAAAAGREVVTDGA